MTLKPPVRIAVTGAAGQIAYATLFRIAGGIMLGRDQPVILQLLDLPQAQQALRGVIMEMQDCAFPLLADIFATDDPEVALQRCRHRPLDWSAPAYPRHGARRLAARQWRNFQSTRRGVEQSCPSQR